MSLVAEMEKQTALRAMARAQGILGDLSREIQSSLRTGDAGHELADEVSRWIPDLLVIGARGRTAGPNVPLGSVAELLLRATRCPTLVVRA
jgi:nucleotide-binding universal stress UspA family protein